LSLDAWLDALPRTRLGRFGREVPVYRACGVAGFYLAVMVTLGVGVLSGTSPLVLALVCLACGLSFFAWAYFRKALNGDETIVLVEHVWFALLCTAAALFALGVPPLPYLDAAAIGLCVFLAAGRVGCVLVGCCHGRPSSFGIRYGAEAVRDGFPPELEGVRLLPVPAFEAAGLVAIGVVGLLALATAPPGTALVWFLAAYAVLRFGLEGLRGDQRPHVLGLSVNRWMCLGQFGFALWLGEHALGPGLSRPRELALFAVLVAALAALLGVRRAVDGRPALLGDDHLRELRALAAEVVAETHPDAVPRARATSKGVTVAASALGNSSGAHVSLSLASTMRDAGLLCELAAASLPDAEPESAQLTDAGVLHLLVDPASRGLSSDAAASGAAARALYGAAIRRCQEGQRNDTVSAAALRTAYFEPYAARDVERALP
jgi:hypothetical protein